MVLIWVFRLAVLVLGPAVGYFQSTQRLKGILAGLLISLVVLGIEISLVQVPLAQMVLGIMGAVLGIFLGGLLDVVVQQLGQSGLMEFWGNFSLLVKILLAYLGLVLVVKKYPELDSVDQKLLGAWAKQRGERLLVMDSSSLIDGRILDVLKTKFLTEATLIAARAVLDELQRLADDADNQKRTRGRRGLDILAKIQEENLLPLRILDMDYPEVKETDLKLLRLTQELKAKLVTTDYNLYKVSNIHGVEVLNINDLALALKPVVLPGEALSIYLVKDGREKDQAVGYLDDGTMVVVENARGLIGKKVDVQVASILQTSAGKMVFTRLRNGQERHPANP
ncbi:MAG: TRAM domain-containing protein [Elusimicrobia bacterium]|nr:TRAM domain-containing protein [Elusimicrobiota bacterium]